MCQNSRRAELPSGPSTSIVRLGGPRSLCELVLAVEGSSSWSLTFSGKDTGERPIWERGAAETASCRAAIRGGNAGGSAVKRCFSKRIAVSHGDVMHLSGSGTAMAMLC
jgi:hypothetical protein